MQNMINNGFGKNPPSILENIICCFLNENIVREHFTAFHHLYLLTVTNERP